MHGFLPPIFSSVTVVTIRKTTQSYNHFACHYKFDKQLKQIMVMVFKTDFSGTNYPAETVSEGPLTTLIFQYYRFSRRIRGQMRDGLGP
jgi:hypothetical protein